LRVVEIDSDELGEGTAEINEKSERRHLKAKVKCKRLRRSSYGF